MTEESVAEVLVSAGRLQRLIRAYREVVLQNHRKHFDWNEGSGDFAECTRGDCARARSVLGDW